MKRQCYLLLLYFCLIINCHTIQSDGNISPERLAEIAKLRSELSAALEDDDANAPPPPGVVVQPGWTQQSSVLPKTKVVVDEASLAAVAALRSEINQAVVSGSFAQADPSNVDEVRALEAELSQRAQHVKKLDVPTLGAALNTKEPNVVDSSYDMSIDLDDLQNLQLSQRRTREMLILKRIVEDFSFTLGADVEQWATLNYNGTTHFVGRRQTDLVIVQRTPDGTSFQPSHIVTLPHPISLMVAFDRWDNIKHVQETIIVSISQSHLLWHRYDNTIGEYTLAWTWPLDSEIMSVAPFPLDGREYIAIATSRSLSIFTYELETEQFWIVQRLHLSRHCGNVAVLDTGRDLLVAVAQINETLVYAYNTHGRQQPIDAGIHLQLWQTIKSPLVGDIDAFQMGGRYYLAFGGQSPQILQYTQGRLEPTTLLGQNFGLVELFLPIPVRTYRDDLLLLVQHRVNFTTHSLVVLETLVWTGEAFEASPPAPCELGTLIVYGVGCMIDERRDAGVRGAAILRLGETPQLLVPRHGEESGLYVLHTELLPRNTELKDLQDIQEYLRDWVDEQSEVIELAKKQLTTTDTIADFDEITTPLLVLNDNSSSSSSSSWQSLLVNDIPWTAEDSSINLLDLIQQMRILHHDLLGSSDAADADADEDRQRVKRQLPQIFHFDYESLEVDAIDVDDLQVEQLNNANYYIQNGSISFNGTINVQHFEVMEPNRPILPKLEIMEDLECDFINGMNWMDLDNQLIWLNEPLQLSKLDVKGAVIFEQHVEINTLNLLNFPSDYLWANENTTSIVEASKQFTTTLTVNAVDTVGTINGVDPLDAIILNDISQQWHGPVTFTQLEVGVEMQLNRSSTDRLESRQFNYQFKNPTLEESQIIHADCYFNELEINGPLIIHGQLDKLNVATFIGDIAQRPKDIFNDIIRISGFKHFHQLALPIDAHIMDAAISGYPIDKFITKQTAQTIDVEQFNGYIYFHQLQLVDGGNYDGVNITQLLADSLRINETLVASNTQLNFVQMSPEFVDLQVQRNLNDAALTQYQTLNEPLQLAAGSQFDRLEAQIVDVTHGGDIIGDGKLNGFQRDQRNQRNLYVKELVLSEGVNVIHLHGMNATLVLDFLERLDELPIMVFSGQLQVERIIVTGGDIHISGRLNGRDFAQLEREVVWLDRPNELRTRWKFDDADASPIIVMGNLNILGSYNEHLLPELINDIVFRTKTPEPITIKATKSFRQTLMVRNELQLEAINGMKFERLANRKRSNNFTGNVVLDGQLFVNKLHVLSTINLIDLKELEMRLQYDNEVNAFVQRGWVSMPTQYNLNDLTVHGRIGNSANGGDKPLSIFLNDLVYRGQPVVKLDKHKVFTGRVNIQHNLYIENLNGLMIADLIRNLIYINGVGVGAGAGESLVTVNSSVRFTANVEMMSQLLAQQLTLWDGHLNGCNFAEWLEESIRIDGEWEMARVTFAPSVLDGNALQVRLVNGVDLGQVLTLHTIQNLTAPLVAEQVNLDGNLDVVGGTVNGVNLVDAHANTLMVDAVGQVVTTPLLMRSLHVYGSMKTVTPVNTDRDVNLDLNDVATLNEPILELQTPLYFAGLRTGSLCTEYPIAGINFTAWYERSLWARGKAMQRITGSWNVQRLFVKYRTLEKRFIPTNWGRLKVKELRKSFILNQPMDANNIRRVFTMQTTLSDGNYLLVNEVDGCWTRIYHWNGTRYIGGKRFESGPIDDVANNLHNVEDEKKDLCFLTNNSEKNLENCKQLGSLQIWCIRESLNIERIALNDTELNRFNEQQQRQLSNPSIYKFLLPRPTATKGLVVGHLMADSSFDSNDCRELITRLLDDLVFRLHTEVNITQLSIPESDLFDERLVEEFIALMDTLYEQEIYPKEIFELVPVATLPLPDNPARVLAVRSVQLIWPVAEQLTDVIVRLPNNDTENRELSELVKRQLGETMAKVLLLANVPTDASGYTSQLNAVIARIHQMQHDLVDLMQPEEGDLEAAASEVQQSAELPLSPQTLRLVVGVAGKAELLYARVTMDPSSSASRIQLHYANGTIFQSLETATTTTRHLLELRVRDETLLAFVEGCCRVRVFIYRGSAKGFESLAQFDTKTIVDMIAVRLPVQQHLLPSLSLSSGAFYALGVVHDRNIDFYEFVSSGGLF